jgi:hypothetical protein
VETLKRLIFMAIIPMIPDASVIFKHAAVITMALLYLQLYRWMQPFVEQHNNYLAELGCVQIILLALVSLLRQFADYRWTANSRQQMLLYDWIYVGVMCAQCVYLVVLMCGRYRQLMGYPLLAYQKLLYLIKYLVVSMICGYDLNAFDKDADDYNDDEEESDVEQSHRNRISAEQLVSMRQSQLLLQHMDTQTKLLARLLQDGGEIRNESRRPPIPTASSKYRYDRYRRDGFGEHDDDDYDESMDCEDDNAYGGSSRWHPRQDYDLNGPSPSRVRHSPSTRNGDYRVSSKSDRYAEREIEEHKYMGSHRFPSIRSQDRRVQQQKSFRGGPRYEHGPSSRRVGSVKEHEDLHYHEDDEEMVLLASSRETEDLLYARDSDRRHQYPAADRELRESTNTVTHSLRNFRDENDNVSQDRYAELQQSPPQRQSGRMPRDQHIDRGASTKMSPLSVAGNVTLPQDAPKTAVKPNTVSAASGRARIDATTAVVQNSSEDNSPYSQKDEREPQAQHQYIVHAVSRKSSSRAAAPLSPERGLAQSSSSRGVSETIKSAPVGVKRGVAPSQVSTSSEAATTDPSYFDRSSRDSTRSTERLVENEEVESLSKRSQRSGSSSSYASSQNSVYSTNPISGAVDGKPTKSLPTERRLQSSQSLLHRSSDCISRDPVRGPQLLDDPNSIPMLGGRSNLHPSDEQPLSDLDDDSYESSDYSVYSTPSLSKTERRGDGRNEERANIASVDQFSLARTPQKVASNRGKSIKTVQSAPVDVPLLQHGSKAAVEPRSAANSGQARKAAAASVAPKGPEVNSPHRQKDKTEPHTQHQYIVHAVSTDRPPASASRLLGVPEVTWRLQMGESGVSTGERVFLPPFGASMGITDGQLIRVQAASSPQTVQVGEEFPVVLRITNTTTKTVSVKLLSREQLPPQSQAQVSPTAAQAQQHQQLSNSTPISFSRAVSGGGGVSALLTAIHSSLPNNNSDDPNSVGYNGLSVPTSSTHYSVEKALSGSNFFAHHTAGLCVTGLSSFFVSLLAPNESTDITITVYALMSGLQELKSLVAVDLITGREYPVGSLFKTFVYDDNSETASSSSLLSPTAPEIKSM